jgi:hypothetical protein
MRVTSHPLPLPTLNNRSPTPWHAWVLSNIIRGIPPHYKHYSNNNHSPPPTSDSSQQMRKQRRTGKEGNKVSGKDMVWGWQKVVYGNRVAVALKVNNKKKMRRTPKPKQNSPIPMQVKEKSMLSSTATSSWSLSSPYLLTSSGKESNCQYPMKEVFRR